MAGSTELRRGALALAVFLATQGCATGGVFRAGLLTDAPLRYEAAYTDGKRLWLVYEGATHDGEGREVDRGRRAVRLDLADLDPARGHPIDAFPLEHVPATRMPPTATTRLALWRDAAAARGSGDAPGLRLTIADGREEGFTPVHLTGLPPDARFHSGALVERRTAGWVWASLPFALTADIVTWTLLGPFATTFFVAGE